MKFKIIGISLLLSVLFALLVTLSDINFQWELIKLKFFLKNMAFIGIPILISSTITYYSSVKAMKKREEDDKL
jgi:heme/copper-type cytochrome/quinol oxidase subunit 3